MNKNTKTQDRKVYAKIAKAAFDTTRPLLAQIVITKRCNLSCSYCFEFDKVSKPVPIAILKSRMDELKRLRTVFVTLNGGEPLLHPQITELVQYISTLGMIPMINSNGWLLTPQLIHNLNEAGLYGMQISCDSMRDNSNTRKSMKRLLPKLLLLKEQANFKVRINGVLGSTPASEVIAVAKTVMALDFDFQCSIVRDESGSAIPIDQEMQEAYMTIRSMRGRLPAILHDRFQLPLIQGKEVKWKCRSGARYFHIDTEGIVHLCQPRTGTPGKRLVDYTIEDIKHNFNQVKSCTKRCPHAYAHIGSRLDSFRSQKGA
ncbi:MAG: radical SAM protein [Crocinitomix sp.]|nr:radical SAM protein [Crocinitomix sp.]